MFNWNQGNIRLAEADLIHNRAEINRIRGLLQNELGTVYNRYYTQLQFVRNIQAVSLPELRSAYSLSLDASNRVRDTWLEVLARQKAYYEMLLMFSGMRSRADPAAAGR